MGGFNDLTVEWHPAGTWIAIDEYDGSESCSRAPDGEGEYLHPSAERLREASQERWATRWKTVADALGKTMVLHVEAESGAEDLLIHESVAKTVPYYQALLDNGFLDPPRPSAGDRCLPRRVYVQGNHQALPIRRRTKRADGGRGHAPV